MKTATARKRAAHASVIAWMAVSGCAREPDAEPAAVAVSCSAAGMTASAPAPASDLPEPVALLTARILAAATACDYDELERLALAGDGGFSFTFGGQEGGPAAHWRELEDGRQDAPLALLVRVLSTPPATMELPPPDAKTLYVWPAASAREVPTEEDWALVARIYPPDRVTRMKEDTAKLGIGYLGYRLGITASGDWIYFVAGD